MIIGSGIGGLNEFETQHTTMMHKGPSRISPFTIPKLMVNAASGQVSIRWGLRGPNSAVATACASAANAIGDAFKLIQDGQADVMITGGSEAAITHMGLGGFAAMRALSTRNDDPTRASRPFDRDRDGFVLPKGPASGLSKSHRRRRHSGTGTQVQMDVAARLKAPSRRPTSSSRSATPSSTATGHTTVSTSTRTPTSSSATFFQVIGNHDVVTQDGATSTRSRRLGTTRATPSSTSSDWGNAHFTCLDSQHWLSSSTSHPGAQAAQEPWVTADLDAVDAQDLEVRLLPSPALHDGRRRGRPDHELGRRFRRAASTWCSTATHTSTSGPISCRAGACSRTRGTRTRRPRP